MCIRDSSDTDSDGSDEEDEAGELREDDDDDYEVAMDTQESGTSLNDASPSSNKRKLDESSSGKLKRIIIWQTQSSANPCALIGTFSVRILQYGPFPWKRSNPCIFVLERSRQIQNL